MHNARSSGGRLEIVLKDLQPPRTPPNNPATGSARVNAGAVPAESARIHGIAARRHRAGFAGSPAIVGTAGILVLMSLVVVFLLGQSMRKSDHQVAAERHLAVSAAVASTRQADNLERIRATRAAVAQQRRHDRGVVRRVRRRLQRASAERARQSYASGQTVGYSSGQAAGYQTGTQDGLRRGSDDLTCSDDPDVGWLPYCP